MVKEFAFVKNLTFWHA